MHSRASANNAIVDGYSVAAFKRLSLKIVAPELPGRKSSLVVPLTSRDRRSGSFQPGAQESNTQRCADLHNLPIYRDNGRDAPKPYPALRRAASLDPLEPPHKGNSGSVSAREVDQDVQSRPRPTQSVARHASSHHVLPALLAYRQYAREIRHSLGPLPQCVWPGDAKTESRRSRYDSCRHVAGTASLDRGFSTGIM